MLTGRFEIGEINRGGQASRSGIEAELGYSYNVNGEFFAGFYRKEFMSQKSAEAFLDSLRGKDVFIRYQPDLPQNSVVREQDNPHLFLTQ